MGGVAPRRQGVADAVRPLARRMLPRIGRRSAATILATARWFGLRDHVRAGLVREARRRLRAGDRHGADAILDAVGAATDTNGERRSVATQLRGADPAAMIETIQEHIAAHEFDAALELAELGVTVHPKVLRLHDLLIALLDHFGDHDRALSLALPNAQRRIRRLRRLREQGLPPRRLTRDTRIFISGYFYSGSGAVLDWLRDFPGTEKWTPTGELRLLKFPGGFDDLCKRHAEQGALTATDLIAHYLHITGWKVTLAPPGTYDRWAVINRNSRRMYRKEVAFGYLAALLEGFVELADDPATSATTEALEDQLRHDLERALDAAATDAQADYLLVDQAITAWRFELLRLVPPSTFVSVHRDPRDQYAEVSQVLAQPGRTPMRAERFVKRYRGNREKVDRLAPEFERDPGHRIIRLGFEDFVVDHDRHAPRLAEQLGFDLRDRVPDRFDPERSRANIGKHATVLSDDDRTTLEDGVAEFLSPHANIGSAADPARTSG